MAPAPSLVRAITPPTGVREPAGETISLNVPLTNDSISMVTLSVSISATASPLLTKSPTFLSQRTIVPSVISKPILGIVISAMIVPPGDCS